MANIFTRAAIGKIMADENLTPEQRTEQVFSLYGRALDDGYIAKAAAQQTQETALANAKAEWEKGIKMPNPKESDDYKSLKSEFDAFKAMQAARTSEDFKGVKSKFFETVYNMVDRGDGAKPVREQMEGIRKDFEEYFTAADVPASSARHNPPPSVVLPAGGAPTPGAKLTLSEAMKRANAGEAIDISQIGK